MHYTTIVNATPPMTRYAYVCDPKYCRKTRTKKYFYCRVDTPQTKRRQSVRTGKHDINRARTRGHTDIFSGLEHSIFAAGRCDNNFWIVLLFLKVSRLAIIRFSTLPFAIGYLYSLISSYDRVVVSLIKIKLYKRRMELITTAIRPRSSTSLQTRNRIVNVIHVNVMHVNVIHVCSSNSQKHLSG